MPKGMGLRANFEMTMEYVCYAVTAVCVIIVILGYIFGCMSDYAALALITIGAYSVLMSWYMQVTSAQHIQYLQGEKILNKIEEEFQTQYHLHVDGVYEKSSAVLSIEHSGVYTFVTKTGLFDVYISPDYKIIFAKKE